MKQEVILVTPTDEAIGAMEKMEAHEKGLLHRAFSVFIFDDSGRMLLQQRALEKYHGGGLWTNACCSHPGPGEPVAVAATRRLNEELGFTTTLQKIFAFTYKAPVENNLIEHEYDHVFVGQYNGTINVNSQEVLNTAFYSRQQIQLLLQTSPQLFTAWFKLAFERVDAWWQQAYKEEQPVVG